MDFSPRYRLLYRVTSHVGSIELSLESIRTHEALSTRLLRKRLLLYDLKRMQGFPPGLAGPDLDLQPDNHPVYVQHPEAPIYITTEALDVPPVTAPRTTVRAQGSQYWLKCSSRGALEHVHLTRVHTQWTQAACP